MVTITNPKWTIIARTRIQSVRCSRLIASWSAVRRMCSWIGSWITKNDTHEVASATRLPHSGQAGIGGVSTSSVMTMTVSSGPRRFIQGSVPDRD